VAVNFNDTSRRSPAPGRPPADAFLIRPDGYVAWVASARDTDDEAERRLRSALTRWFGAEDIRWHPTREPPAKQRLTLCQLAVSFPTPVPANLTISPGERTRSE